MHSGAIVASTCRSAFRQMSRPHPAIQPLTANQATAVPSPSERRPAPADLSEHIVSVYQLKQGTAYPVNDVVHQFKYIGVAPAGTT